MKYNPRSQLDRARLAEAILRTLQEAGFMEESNRGQKTQERVFWRPVEDVPGFRIRVFTSIENDEVRESGHDAIRVSLVYRNKDGQDRGFGSETRVHRVGDSLGVTDRMLDRMREAWRRAHTIPRCSCGAPKFKSRKGNLVCADFCWK